MAFSHPFFLPLFLFLSFSLFATPYRQDGDDNQQTFLFVSDIHYDPFAQPMLYDSTTRCRPPTSLSPETEILSKSEQQRLQKIATQRQTAASYQNGSLFGHYGCDTPLALLSSTLQAMVQVNPSPEFILYGGDISAHSLGTQSIKAIQTVTSAFALAYPDTPVYFTIGNNDVPHIDYQIKCGPNDWFQILYKLWESSIPSSQKDNFLKMGAYSTSLSPSLLLISFNSLFYSINHHSHGLDPSEDPCGQLQWMSEELEKARKDNMQVWVLGHIMPGIDSYSFTSLYHSSLNEKFIDLLEEYEDIITSTFFGHVHNDEFRVFNYNKTQPSDAVINGIVSSAISPIFGNNPDFSAVEFDLKNGNVTDSQHYWMNLTLANEEGKATWWQLYDFEETYGKVGLDAKGLEILYDDLGENFAVWSDWYTYRGAYSTEETVVPAMGSAGQICLICSLSSTDQDQFAACIGDTEC